jgi:hypothetical protein
MAKFKLKIAEYFDLLINKLDLAVETAIYQSCLDEQLKTELNNQRDAFLSEINQILDFNLKAWSNKEIAPNQELSEEDLFP